MCGRHGTHCNICLGDGFHPSSCTTPAETNNMAGSAREPLDIRCAPAIRRGTGIQWSMSSQLIVLVRSGWTHDGHWIRQRAMEKHFKILLSPVCFFWLRSAFPVPGPGVCNETEYARYPQWQVAAMPCMVGRAHLTVIAMMKLLPGLDDECVDALLILFAAKMEI